jgi:hypothetical protein
MRSGERSLAVRSSILFLSGSIYKSPAEFGWTPRDAVRLSSTFTPFQKSRGLMTPTLNDGDGGGGGESARANPLLDYK